MNPESLIKSFENKAELVEYYESILNKEVISQNNNELKTFIKSRGESYSARMLVNGAWGYAATNNKKDLIKIFNTCHKLASNASVIKKNRTKMKELEINHDNIVSKIKTNPFEISDEDKINFLKNFNKSFQSKELKNAETFIAFSNTRKKYMNSLGSEVSQNDTYSRLMSIIIGGKDLTQAHMTLSAKKGYELIQKLDCQSEAGKLEEKLKRIINAGNVKPGIYNLVIDSILGGTFFHEALGHALEADAYKEKSTCVSMNEQISNEGLTVYDDPTIPYSWGSYSYDHEGIKSKPSLLVDKGKVINFINDTASYFDVPGLKKTANARFDSPCNLPIPRMSNTVVKPGNYSEEELFQKIKNGLFVKGFYGGAVEPLTGIFSFKAEEAVIIENGKLTKSLKGVNLSGDLKKLLKNLKGVGKEAKSEWHGGMCGKKGQSVPVSEKVPPVLVEGVSVGN